MSERVLSEERPIDTNISTATLAGRDVETREERNTERDFVEAQPNVVDRSVTTPANGSYATPKSSAGGEDSTAPLFPSNEASELRARWEALQVGFVDEPRRAVEQADSLVAGAMKRMAEIFSEERARLESQWDQGDSVSTEDLRLALRRYRSFFGRVLSI